MMPITKANKPERSILNWARNLYRRYQFEFENDEPIDGSDAVESLVEFLHIVKANTPELCKRRVKKKTISPRRPVRVRSSAITSARHDTTGGSISPPS